MVQEQQQSQSDSGQTVYWTPKGKSYLMQIDSNDILVQVMDF